MSFLITAEDVERYRQRWVDYEYMERLSRRIYYEALRDYYKKLLFERLGEEYWAHRPVFKVDFNTGVQEVRFVDVRPSHDGTTAKLIFNHRTKGGNWSRVESRHDFHSVLLHCASG